MYEVGAIGQLKLANSKEEKMLSLFNEKSFVLFLKIVQYIGKTTTFSVVWNSINL